MSDAPLTLHSATSFDALIVAWDKVRGNNGCSGGDGQTLAAFAADLTDTLRNLSGQLRTDSYRPGPLRRHQIPKDDGSTRPLAIPCVRDRVAQTAVAQTLMPVLDAGFADGSFGYRPGRSVQMAVDRVQALRGQGYGWVVEADIDRAFEMIPHDPVLTALAPLVDRPLLDLIALWLEHAGTELDAPGRGLPQGSPLSPLLSNLFLDGLDDTFADGAIRMIRFADDFLLLARAREEADRALVRAEGWLAAHGLRMNDSGTRVVSFDRGFAFLGRLFVRSLVLDAPDDPDPETTAILQELAEEDAEVERSQAAGHDPAARVLYCLERGRRLGVVNRSYVVEAESGEELLRLSHSRVNRIEIGPGVDCDPAVYRFALVAGTELALTTGAGETQGLLTGVPGRAAALHLAQARVVSDPELATDLARRLVEGRVRNQRARLQVLNRDEKNAEVIWAARELGRSIRKLPGADSVAALRGHEGRAAAVYLEAIGRLCPDEPQPFRRSRPARSPLNAALNYLTALLARDIRAAVLGAGLHPGFGVLHAVADRHEACVWDVMEGFRALMCEGLAVSLFRRNRLKVEMFDVTDAGVRIEQDGRRALVIGYEAGLDRKVKSHHSGTRVVLRRLMLEEARALAHHMRDPIGAPFEPQTQDY